jgi:hypothetical protein
VDYALRADALAAAVETEVEDLLILVLGACLFGGDPLEQIDAHSRLRVGVGVVEVGSLIGGTVVVVG